MKRILSEYYNHDKLWFNHMIYENPKDNYEFHTHDTIEVIMFLNGDVNYIVDGQQHEIRQDDIAIVAPQTYHRVKVLSDTESYERYCVLFDETNLPPEILQKIFCDKKYIIQKASSLIKEMFQRMCHYCEEFDKSVLERLLRSVVTEIIYNALLESNKESSSVPIVMTGAIRDSIEYIDKNLATISSLDELYEYAGLSKCQFHRVFIKELGITPMEYIREKRLILGRNALHQGRRATDVYQQCGFASYAAFYRAYKDKYGYAPSDEMKNAYPKYKIKS